MCDETLNAFRTNAVLLFKTRFHYMLEIFHRNQKPMESFLPEKDQEQLNLTHKQYSLKEKVLPAYQTPIEGLATPGTGKILEVWSMFPVERNITNIF